MVTRPTFSIITANYNSGDKLAATIASVRDQDVDAEHLILDGVSTDGSLALARRHAAETPEVLRVTCARDRGIYDAMNHGIQAASLRCRRC